MIGNDVVDLNDPEARPGATHPRFDGRVFARSELALLRASGAPNRLRWMLWAAKEAAYKVAKKIAPRTVFSPSRFVVKLDETLSGKVTCDEGTLAVRVWEEASTVHAVATGESSPDTRILSGTETLEFYAGGDPEQQSDAVRSLAIARLSENLKVPASDLSIEKRGRVPSVLRNGVDTGIDLSLSHHGRVIGFACELGPMVEACDAQNTHDPLDEELHP